MSGNAKKSSNSKEGLLFGLSPWLLIGVPVILGLVIAILVVRNSEREEEHITQNLLDRADALIWALEAGARTNIMGGREQQPLLQPLIEETARQPGIVYLAVVDSDGCILAHSDPEKVGETVRPGLLPMLSPDEVKKSALIEDSGASLLEVYRGFSPLVGGRVRHHHGGHGVNHWYEQGDTSGSMSQAKATSFVFVGLDKKPFADAMATDNWHNLLAACIVAAFGLAGLISLFWADSHKRSRRRLKDSQALAGEVITSLPLGLITSAPEGKVNTINAAALDMLGLYRDLASGMLVRDIPGLDWDAITNALADKQRVYEREMDLTPPGGDKIPVSVSASEIRDEDRLFLGHLFILRDIAEVKRLQAEVQRNERLTALGNLAAGVAHEIRNPLSSIKGLVSFLASKIPHSGPEEEAAKTILIEVNRLNRVVSELLDFARPGAIKLAVTDINEVISRALRLAGSDIQSKGIQATFTPDLSFPKVFINAERMTQALLNLFLNAVQAMEPGGKLGIAVGVRPENEFAIVVSDTGRGMDKDTLSSIFTPYFTTKGSAGTGVGLAIVHQIIDGHGGRITVSSTPGMGSVFTILLPFRQSL